MQRSPSLQNVISEGNQVFTTSVFHHPYHPTGGSVEAIKCEGIPREIQKTVLWEETSCISLKTSPGWDCCVQGWPLSHRGCFTLVISLSSEAPGWKRDRSEVSVAVAPGDWPTGGSLCPDPPSLHPPAPLLPAPAVTRTPPSLLPPPGPPRQWTNLSLVNPLDIMSYKGAI